MSDDVIYLTEDFIPVDKDDPRMAMVKVRYPDGKIVFGFPEEKPFQQGGKGSGHHGHQGIKGEVGGSLPGKGMTAEERARLDRFNTRVREEKTEGDDPFDAKDMDETSLEAFYKELTNGIGVVFDDEEEALSAYTGDYYVAINDYHRGRGADLGEATVEEINSHTESLDDLFVKDGAAAPENMLVYRKVGFKPSRSQNMIDFFKEAEDKNGVYSFSDKGYLSTSLSGEITSVFSSPMYEVTHNFRIQVPKGTRMFPVGDYSIQALEKNEFEIIFPRDTRFTILSSRWNDDTESQDVLLRVLQ